MDKNVFNNNEFMKLSEISKILKMGKLIKDCSFRYLDKMYNLRTNNTLIYLNNFPDSSILETNKISGIISKNNILDQISEDNNLGLWICENPENLFYLIHDYLIRTDFYNKKNDVQISKTAKISKKASIGSYNIIIGDNCVIEDFVKVKPNTIINNNTVIRNHSVIGAKGFEPHIINNKLKLIKHGGVVIIGENVEIQSSVTVSRGLFPSRNTIIGDNVKIADLVHIAHGVEINDNTRIAAGVTVSGNTSIGKNVFIGPGAVISNRLNIGDNSFITIGSVVVRNVKENQKVSGNFAVEHSKMLKNIIKNDLI